MPAIEFQYSITQLSTHGYKLTARTRCTQDKAADAAVFAIQVLPYVQQRARQPEVRFSHICDLAQMQQYSTQYNREYPYFRTDSVQLIVHSRSQVQHVIQLFQERIRHLVRQMHAAQTKPATQTYTVLITP